MNDNLLKQLTDEQLVEHVLNNNRNAYEEIVIRYQDKLARYVSSFTRDKAVVSDVVQEALINAYVHLRSFKRDAKFSSWIYRIAHNVALNYFTRKKRELRLDDDIDISSDDNIVEEYSQLELSKEIKECLSELPVQYSAPLTLYFIEGYSYEEIGSILGLPINTVGTRISRAKNLLKQKYVKRTNR